MSNSITKLASFMRQQQFSFDNTANNIANASTDGFKRQLAVFRNNGISLVVDQGNGKILRTANSMDLYLEGPGYFAVETPQGTLYTRKGSVVLNSDGELSTPEGFKILGTEGPIRVEGNKITFDKNGEVLQDDVPVARLLLEIPKKGANPIPVGRGYFSFEPDKERAANENLVIKSGGLEGSNVNIIKEMTRMIETVRNFGIAQKLMAARGEIYQKSVSELGKTNW